MHREREPSGKNSYIISFLEKLKTRAVRIASFPVTFEAPKNETI